jgi:DNA repair exonuclease SbcCD ATPase subunit
MLILREIEIENFLSFSGKHKFTYAQTGMHLIQGQNLDDFIEGATEAINVSVGSGKSTFCSAAAYALFGEVNKDINRKAVVNKKIKRNLRVALTFEVNGLLYKIERHRKHKNFYNELLLFEWVNNDWNNITQSVSRKTQQKINNLIMLNLEVFFKSVLLSRDDFQQFLKYSPTIRSQLFESIIQLNKLKEYHDKVDKKLKISEKQRGELVIAIQSIQSENKTYQRHIEQDTNELLTKEDTIKGDIKKLNEKIKIFASQHKTAQEFLSDVEKCYYYTKEYQEAKNKYSNYKKELRSNNELIDQTTQKIKFIQKQLDQANVRLNELKPLTCPQCSTVLDDFQKQRNLYKIEIKDLTNELNKEVKNFNNLTEKHNEIEESGNNVFEIAEDIKTQLIKIQIPNQFKSQVIKDAEQNLKNSVADSIQTLKSDVELKETELKSISWDNIKKFEAEIQLNNIQLTDLITQKETLENTIGMLSFLSKILNVQNENSIKQHILNQVLPVFNNIIQQNMNRIYNGNLTLAFNSLFEETIIYNDELYTYQELSTGEKTKVDLAINLSLFDMIKINLNGSSVIFIDEIFSNVDENTIKASLKLIDEKYSKDSAVYLISHNPYIKQILGNAPLVKIIKENGESRIEL